MQARPAAAGSGSAGSGGRSLLALEGLLLLSEWFQWFAFNGPARATQCRRRGRRGRVLAGDVLWFLAALVFRLRFQFSIRSLLLLVVVVAVPCALVGDGNENGQRKQQEAVEEE